MQQNDRESVQRQDPESLAPVPIERLSVENEAALMNRGKGRQLAMLAAGIALCTAAAVPWMRGLDARQRYADALTSAAQLQEKHLDAFFHCALQGVHLSQVTSAQSLHSAIARHSERMGRSYGRKLAQCAPKLAGLPPALSRLEAPKDVQRELGALRAAATELQRAWDGYAVFLTDAGAYDEAGAAPRIEGITRAFDGYEERRTAFENALRARR